MDNLFIFIVVEFPQKKSTYLFNINFKSGLYPFLILAAAVGIEHKEIAVLMGWGNKRLDYYFTRMHNLGITRQVIEKSGIRVYYAAKTGEIAADWKLHKDRFPRLAKRMEQAEGRALDRQEGRYITRVRRKAAFYAAKLEK